MARVARSHYTRSMNAAQCGGAVAQGCMVRSDTVTCCGWIISVECD